jgi:hypothetical protein
MSVGSVMSVKIINYPHYPTQHTTPTHHTIHTQHTTPTQHTTHTLFVLLFNHLVNFIYSFVLIFFPRALNRHE